ncbi:S-adenosyl-L-methionine-dependent methyltransferase [Guyanagaster necrorhizus]|uniref:S-adenosyl-L-methionine-dependent methyltransferase n=1 Tax=Guyanagaster necrorhizus TaxID=856835 RepID=A0A9P7W2Z9_9AGAR|nr:S-adenosyl-L-methionine-dependent methyltransferase [Guyanagaster necrorhizus MCA 3950]KAG7452431.1 S-adenosyl-L-methionine-dependent methyltransferase [Guyanagaster necrorhizus MCA 3950]
MTPCWILLKRQRIAQSSLFFHLRRGMVIVHNVAQSGFGSGTNELYDRARPSYQSNALSAIREAVKATAPLNVVEIGAGTGLFTKSLLKHPDFSSAIKELRAVEPSAGMREVFVKTVQDERVSVREGTFDTTNIENGWADLVTIAQARAFHWCPDFDAASVEFARILKPGGVVAFIWNLEDRDAARWVAQLRNQIEQHEAGTPQFRLGLWRKTFDTDSYKKVFQPPVEKTWAYTLPCNVSLAVDRANSKSYIQTLPDDVRSKVLDDVKAIVERGDDKVWIDESQGTFEYPYQTFLVISHQKN